MRDRVLDWLRDRRGQDTTISQLRKALFRRQPEQMGDVLKKLADAGLITIVTTRTGGRPMTTIKLSDLSDTLSDLSDTDLALKIFDWITDSENNEIGANSRVCFGVERLRRALGVEKSELDAALSLLERNTVIGARHTEHIRGREVRQIMPPWLERGVRERLIRILKPTPSPVHVPHGPARVLKTVSLYIRHQLMTFNEGQIVENEAQISALLTAGAVLAKLENAGARMCANPKCRQRFDLSEAAPIDFPVLEALKYDTITRNGTSFWFKRGDVILDRSWCLFMTAGPMRERLWDTVRELPADDYVSCPHCGHVTKKLAARIM